MRIVYRITFFVITAVTIYYVIQKDWNFVVGGGLIAMTMLLPAAFPNLEIRRFWRKRDK